ncbi:MAG TPA: ATP-binding protein [Bacillota bacterium]|jgi:signal transduction histidine kinase
MNRSIVAKLGIGILSLIAVTLVILSVAVAAVVSRFYVQTRVVELTRHGQKIVELAESGRFGSQSQDLINLVAGMSGATVALIGPEGQVINCSSGGAHGEAGHLGLMHGAVEALSGKAAWTTERDPSTGAPVLTVALPIRVEGQPSALLFLAPQAPIQETIRAIDRVLLTVAGAVVAIVTVLAFLLSRTLSRPLLNMASVAGDMAGGDFSRRISVHSEDEVGQLGRSLNHLSERLEGSLSALARERDQLTEVLRRERQLAKAQKDFLADVSHELRTPLSYLQGYSEAILDGLVDKDEERKFLQIILDESQRLRRLVTDLLDLTVVESGQAPMRPENVPVVGVIREVIIPLDPLAHAGGVSLVEPSLSIEQSPTVWADSDALKRILVNLLDNAIRHSPPGSEVAVAVWPSSDDGGPVSISVTDQGPGLEPEVLSKVWTRFFKVDKSRCRDSSGTGLGLAIVRSLAEAQGGTVSATSRPGRGSTFTVSLPSRPPTTQPSRPPSGGPANGG